MVAQYFKSRCRLDAKILNPFEALWKLSASIVSLHSANTLCLRVSCVPRIRQQLLTECYL
jgi:hypothetical protein